MATQYGIKYAIHLITTHFGNLVATVCECLLRRGPLTLQLIVRYTELTPSKVKNSLLVLIQHNCAQAFIVEQQGGFGQGPKLDTQYMAVFDNIIHRSRFPKFLAIVSKKFDKPCVELLEGLLQHGRLTLNQMLDRAKSSQREGNDVALDAVQETLLKLLSARFVERCPNPEPVLPSSTEEDSRATKRGSKYAKIFEEKKTIEQRALEEGTPAEGIRFLFINDSESKVDEEKDENDTNSPIAGKKRMYDSLESDKEGGATDQQLILWRANFEEFMRHLRHQACIENVRTRLDNGAVIVLSAMLEATRSAEKKVKTENSVPLSLNSIYEEVIKSEAGRNKTVDHVKASLDQLGCLPFVSTARDSYRIEFKTIIELAQNEEVESIVLKRYGREAYRIFRLLSNADCLLETDKIADATFVEKKDTLIILYKLWKDEYLHVEKVQLAVGKDAKFFLWKVNKHHVREHVLDEMFHAALNLSLREAHELEQEKELLYLPQDKRVNRIRKLKLLLESSLMKLDDAILLFHDF